MKAVEVTPTTTEAMVQPRARPPASLRETFITGAGVEPRPAQLACVQRVCSALAIDCQNAEPSNYLIQHATGSGKSLTIAALAHALTTLVDDNSNRFRLVIIVSDRKSLEEQIGGVVGGFFKAHGDGVQLERAESSLHLQQLVSSTPDDGTCRIVVTTFQKALRTAGVGVEVDEADEGDEEAPAADAESAVAPTATSMGDDYGWSASSSVPASNHGSSGGECNLARVAILADEAHRSHGHGTTAALHALLCGSTGQPRHCTYVSFTATPSEIALRLFGVVNHESGRREPFHCFSLQQALAAGLCVDVLSRYQTAKPKVTVTDKRGKARCLEDVLSAAARRGASSRTMERAAAAREALLHGKACEAATFTCEAIAEASAAGMDDPKVMMVVRSRQHCRDFRAAILTSLDRGNGEGVSSAASTDSSVSTQTAESEDVKSVAQRLRVLVAFSGTLDGSGGLPSATERTLNDSGDAVSAFRATGPALLIVCNKLETGFDEPRVCAMIIDRTLRGAHAVQVLGRANRTCPCKLPPRVLDFANTAADIAAAYRGFYGASSRLMHEHERRQHLGREFAYISQLLLEMIADRSIRAVTADAVASDSFDSLVANLEEYIRDCEVLGEEAAALPYGFATRLLSEVRAGAVGQCARGATGGGGANGEGSGSSGSGYRVETSGLVTTFCGRISIDGSETRARLARLLTRPLTQAAELSLSGDAGASVTLPAAAAAAAAITERTVAATVSAAATMSDRGGTMSLEDLHRADGYFKRLTSGVATVSDGQPFLVALLHQPPPSVQALRESKAGLSLKSLAKGHGNAVVSSLAGALLTKWKAAAEAEERRRGRAAALKIETSGGGGATACGEGGEGDSELDRVRQTAAVHLAEALRANGGTVGDGTLATSIERTLFQKSGQSTAKAYRSRARLLCSSLRSARGEGLRKRLRNGELTVEQFGCMGDKELAEELLTEHDKRRRLERKERDARALEMLRVENTAEVTDAYSCESCGSRRCTQFNTNSMGAVHLTSVPDMIVQCLDCNHSFTV
jgi:hypothetical protein